jgi:hypothetical protein
MARGDSSLAGTDIPYRGWGFTMPITPFLRGQALDPDAIRAMGIAFQDVCRMLGLTDKADAATEAVARKVIELAQRGERDPVRLADAVLKSFEADE